MSGDYGGAIRLAGQPRLVNCVFSGNHSGQGGGAIINYTDCYPILINCVFASNVADASGGALYNWTVDVSVTGVNCVFWGNSDSGGSDESAQIHGGTVDVSYSCIQGLDAFAGNGNCGDDPLFVQMPDPGPDEIWGTEDDDYGDLRLQPGSPCIDAGSNFEVPLDEIDVDDDGCFGERFPIDLDGNRRFFDDPATEDTGIGCGPIVDMGPYEFGAGPPSPDDPCTGDLNCDGQVDFFDIDPFVLAVTDPAAFEEQYPECDLLNADANFDGGVDFFDIDCFVALIMG